MPTSPRLVCALLAAQLAVAPAVEPFRIRSAIPFSASETPSSRELQQAGAQPSTLKIDASLVPVRVVVHDSKGQTVGGLAKEDFQVFDEGKSQPVSQFFAFHHGGKQSDPTAPPTTTLDDTDIYTVFVFDDLHIEHDDFAPARDAAVRHLATLPQSEFAALVTTSGQPGLDFTVDREKLRQTFDNLRPHIPLGPDCPRLSYYQADLIQNQQNEVALKAATQLAIKCGFTRDKRANSAREAALSAAAEAIHFGRADSDRALLILKNLIHRMSKAPGQRNIILISNGIFCERYDTESEIADLAVRGNVTVNALDPAGLQPFIPSSTGPASQAPGNAITGSMAEEMNQFAAWTVLSDLSAASGGVFFHDNNDLDEGFRRAAGAPEYSYLLAFAPDPSNKPGRTHKLKVKLTTSNSLKIQARTAYFAPAKK